MILGQISYLDCLVFLLFLAPQLLIHVGLFQTSFCVFHALPFFIFQLPFQLITERYFTPRLHRSPFVQHATPFQDFVIRCVRYAFANIPANIGAVFFSKEVALPFTRFRMLRHGYWRSPTHWREIEFDGVKALYIIKDPSKPPSMILCYYHGGGFSMGSPYFYLEFLLALHAHLSLFPHFSNPAILAPVYTRVPHASFPTQLHQCLTAYNHSLTLLSHDSSRLALAGDSAGCTLILSLLLYLADPARVRVHPANGKPVRPALAVLLSPWTTLVSPLHHDTPSDYLCTSSLHLYATQYAGSPSNLDNPLASPGLLTSSKHKTRGAPRGLSKPSSHNPSSPSWSLASPRHGFSIHYGSEEVLAPAIRQWVRGVRSEGVGVRTVEEPGGVHAWVVARLFLGGGREERVRGVREVAEVVAGCVGRG